MAIRSADPMQTRHRRVNEAIFRILTIVALALVVGPAAWVLVGVAARALPHWKWSVLWTPSQGAGGGLLNAILGTLVLMVGVLIVAGTIGILAGIYLAEFVSNRRSGKAGGRLLRSATDVLSGVPSITLGFVAYGGKAGGRLLRSATDVLSGVPSITLGFVAYVALVVGLHWGFSLLPAVIVLSVMVIPYIAKATESALSQVPTSYREGAEALGMSSGYALRKVVVKSALPGMVTGLLIALAISSGETAPLLLTAGYTDTLPKAALLHQPIAYLTYPIWTFYNYPSNQAHYLAYDSALVLVVLILALLVGARLLVARTQRHAEGGRRRTRSA